MATCNFEAMVEDMVDVSDSFHRLLAFRYRRCSAVCSASPRRVQRPRVKFVERM